MKREDCWMTFTQALEQFLVARETLIDRPCARLKELAESNLNDAKDHLEALTGNEDDL